MPIVLYIRAENHTQQLTSNADQLTVAFSATPIDTILGKLPLSQHQAINTTATTTTTDRRKSSWLQTLVPDNQHKSKLKLKCALPVTDGAFE